jgi:ClpP class serine protease
MWAQRKPLLEKLERERGTKLICYLTSDRLNALAQIANDVWPLFANHVAELRGKGWTGKLDVLIFTTGGDTLAAFGLARLLRESADWIGALVPGKCHSAGTLFALGADEIFMCQAGTLSPIDPSLVTPLNPTVDGPIPGQRQAVPVSVESVAGFKALVEDWSLEEAGKAEAFKTLADKVHPLALGAVYRSRQQIERLARTLLDQHRSGDSSVTEIIKTLTRELGSHDYPISRREARQLLQMQVATDNDVVEELVWSLYQDFAKDMKLGVPFNPPVEAAQRQRSNQAPPWKLPQQLAIIETRESRDVFEQEIEVAPATVPAAAGQILLRQEVIASGWKHYT